MASSIVSSPLAHSHHPPSYRQRQDLMSSLLVARQAQYFSHLRIKHSSVIQEAMPWRKQPFLLQNIYTLANIKEKHLSYFRTYNLLQPSISADAGGSDQYAEGKNV